MNEELLEEAQRSLSLMTIKLHRASLDRADDFFSEDRDERDRFQTMQNASGLILELEVDNGERSRIYRVFITLGIRALAPLKSNDEEASKESVDDERFRIEATFRADYEMKNDLGDEALQEFMRYNVLHNVWPFWREYVFNLVQRADLPDIAIPLYSR